MDHENFTGLYLHSILCAKCPLLSYPITYAGTAPVHFMDQLVFSCITTMHLHVSQANLSPSYCLLFLDQSNLSEIVQFYLNLDSGSCPYLCLYILTTLVWVVSPVCALCHCGFLFLQFKFPRGSFPSNQLSPFFLKSKCWYTLTGDLSSLLFSPISKHALPLTKWHTSRWVELACHYNVQLQQPCRVHVLC
jgi:hypothetical protein